MDSEEIDPIAEADVYMAYGRDTQAEEILKEALAKDSNRQAIKVKLLEIYASRKDMASFELVANDLNSATGGTGPEWEKAVALGAALDPNNPLYGGTPAPVAAMDMASTQILNIADLAPAAGPSAERAAEETPADAMPEATSGLDFDLDLGAEPAEAVSQPDVELDVAAAAKEDSASAGLDFDLDLGGDKSKAETIDFSAESPALELDQAGSDTASAVVASSGGLDIDFDLPGDDKKPEESSAPTVADSGLDFDLGGDQAPEPAVELQPVAELDLSSISFDLGTPGNGSGEPPAMDAHWQEVATKLDLAKAYQDMGDKDGARELLNEVLNEGDHTQQTQAKSLLESLEV
jgi:pilus assembly protein FimV